MRKLSAVLIAVTSVTAQLNLVGLDAAGVGLSETDSGPATGAGDVVVNEVATSGPFGETDEFVELYNTGSHRVELAGWELVVCDMPDVWRVEVRFGPDDELTAGGRLLLAHPNYVVPFGATPDRVYFTDAPRDGGWILHDPSNGYTDGVGLRGGLVCTEGDPGPQCDWEAGEAVTRDPQGRDTNDNAADFACMPRTPRF